MGDIDPRAIATDLGINADDVPEAELTDRLLAALVERNELLRKLSVIQRSISHRAPLQEVLDAITAGARELLGDDVVGLRLLDPDDPNWMILRSANGLTDSMSDVLERAPVGEGAGGRAIKENRLVIVDDYQSDPGHFQALAEAGLRAAMAAPVYENGALAGSLVVASFAEGRVYSPIEQETLMAFAEHASLALTDARTIEHLREAQRAKDMFFAMASHELKTPLTVIMGTLRTIEKHHEALSGPLRGEMLSSAYERGHELKSLIDRLLQGARAELAGTMESVSLRHLIDRATSGFDRERLEIEIAPDVTVETDEGAVRELVGVLLENALKHSSPTGRIRVSSNIDGTVATVAVASEGSFPAGLNTADLFQPFLRGPGAQGEGVGLGLYIAARLADALQGEISATSADGEVIFTFRFPTTASAMMRPASARVT